MGERRPRAPKETARRDGRGRIVSSIEGWSGGMYPCGPHARRMERKNRAFMRGWNAWEYRCPHHDPICRERKRVLMRQWHEGVRISRETGLYTEPMNGPNYCECDCGPCMEHYYREFPEDRPEARP